MGDARGDHARYGKSAPVDLAEHPTEHERQCGIANHAVGEAFEAQKRYGKQNPVAYNACYSGIAFVAFRHGVEYELAHKVEHAEQQNRHPGKFPAWADGFTLSVWHVPHGSRSPDEADEGCDRHEADCDINDAWQCDGQHEAR